MTFSAIDLFGELFSGSENTHCSLKKTNLCARTNNKCRCILVLIKKVLVDLKTHSTCFL